MGNFLFVTSDLHIPPHYMAYKRFLMSLRAHVRITLLSLELPVIFHMAADSDLGDLERYCKSLGCFQSVKSSCENANSAGRYHILEAGINVVTLWDFIDENAYSQCYQKVFSDDQYIFESIYSGQVDVAGNAKTDMSLCMKARYDSIAELNARQVLFYKLVCFGIELTIAVSKAYSHAMSSAITKSGQILIPDKYSAYVSAADYFSALGYSLNVLSLNALNHNQMSIRKLDSSEETISTYHMQRLSREYARPTHMFSFARRYVQTKIIEGNTPWSYSYGYNASSLAKEYMEKDRRGLPAICYFSSSPDEQHSGEYTTADLHLYTGRKQAQFVRYKDEVSFLEELIAVCIKNNLRLVVRLHPRLGSESRSSNVSTHLNAFIELITSFDSDLISTVLPGDACSSYWLAASSDLCFYYRSSMGIELNLLGITAISPNHLDSLSFQGYPYQIESSSLSAGSWLNAIINRYIGTARAKPFVHQAVRSFFISSLANKFEIMERDSTISFPATNEIVSPQAGSVRLLEYINSGSSLEIPPIRGYWEHSDYVPALAEYSRWLLSCFYSRLGLSPEIFRRQREQFCNEVVMLSGM